MVVKLLLEKLILTKTIQDYFHAEMQLYDDALQLFAKRYPIEAARVNMDARSQRDPQLERLLEGVAYLQARTKQQIDLGVHHISETLLWQLVPSYMMPRPSLTIIEWTSRENRFVGIQQLPAGIKLSSLPVGEENTKCVFYTIDPLTLYPLSIENIDYHPGHGKTAQLCFQMVLNEGVVPSSLCLDGITFFINAPLALAQLWYYNLTRHVKCIMVRHPDGSQQVVGGQTAIKSRYLDKAYEAFSGDTNSVCGFDTLSDYFYFPERFMFVQIPTFSCSLKAQRFELLIELHDLDTSLRVFPELFKLHCVPARNAFKTTAEPIRYHQGRGEYPFVVCHQRPQSQKLLCVNKIEGLGKHSGTTTQFTDFYKQIQLEKETNTYRLAYARLKKDTIRQQLIFSDSLTEDMHLSCEVWASNGDYPRQYLHQGSLHLNDHRLSVEFVATNLFKPSAYQHPLFDEQHAMKVLMVEHVHFSALAQLEVLKNLLHFYDKTAEQAHLINQIMKVDIKPFNHFNKGVFEQGLVVELLINEYAFDTQASLYFLGTILHQLLMQHAPLQTMLKTKIIASPSEVVFIWPNEG